MRVTADCDACASLILEHSHPVSTLTRQADDVQKAFQDCHRQLAELERYGAGTTEADTLLETIALPKVRVLERTVKTMREQMEKALRSRTAMEFPTQDAMDKYLKQHPDADKTNHRVVDTTESEMGQGLRQWVKDYRDSTDPKIRRQLKQNIDRVVREKGLDRKRVMKGSEELMRIARELMGGDQYQRLNDAAFNTGNPGYEAGNTAIWYMNGGFFREGVMGYDWLKDHEMLPDVTNTKTLAKTHVFLGWISETSPNKIYRMMQGEIWSPEGEARNLIRIKGLHHTSMSIGDIAVINREVFMVDRMGFKSLGRLG